MSLIYATWLALMVVLAIGIFMIARAIKELRNAPKSDNPLLKLKAMYDQGEITRDDFERLLREELDREQKIRKAA